MLLSRCINNNVIVIVTFHVLCRFFLLDVASNILHSVWQCEITIFIIPHETLCDNTWLFIRETLCQLYIILPTNFSIPITLKLEWYGSTLALTCDVHCNTNWRKLMIISWDKIANSFVAHFTRQHIFIYTIQSTILYSPHAYAGVLLTSMAAIASNIIIIIIIRLT